MFLLQNDAHCISHNSTVQPHVGAHIYMVDPHVYLNAQHAFGEDLTSAPKPLLTPDLP